jgi:hypothetical protein
MTDFEPHMIFVSEEAIRMDVDNIDSTTATLIAKIEIIDRISASFVYGTSADFSGTSVTVPYVNKFLTSVIKQPIEDLTPGITYYCRLTLLTNRGYVSSKIVSFTPCGRALVKTIAASNITSQSATLNAIVMGGGHSTNVIFIYGKSETLSSGQMIKTASIPSTVSGASYIPVSLPISNLETGVTYYFQVQARNTAGISTGAIRSFVALGLPAVETIFINSLVDTKAVIGAKIKPSGTKTTVELMYGFMPDLSGKITVVPFTEQIASDTNVTFEINNILDQHYYCQIKVTNIAGSTVSNIINFIKPRISVLAATEITTTTALLNAIVYSAGYSTSLELVYGTDRQLKGKITKLRIPYKITDSSERKISQILTDLEENTLYYYQFNIKNNSSAIFYSIIDSFTTKGSSMVAAPAVKIHSTINMAGSYAGNTLVTLTGENFSQVKSVVFPTYPKGTSAQFEIMSDNVILALAPAITSPVKMGPLNRGPIILTDVSGQSVPTEMEYAYTAPTKNGCFPSSATVQTCDGKEIKMSELKIGETIQTSLTAEFSEVYLFTHALATAEATFIRLTLESGLQLELTPCHYLYVNGSILPAEEVQRGDTLETVNSPTDQVVNIAWVAAQGLFNPHTLTGDIVVNGVRTSTYTKAMPVKLAHAILEPVRFLYSIGAF